MTWHRHEIVRVLRHILRLKRLFAHKDEGDVITNRAKIELAGQAAAINRPSLDAAEEFKGFPAEKE